MITIVDYGTANLGSMQNMLRRLGIETRRAVTPDAIRTATKLILPGVGAFDHGMTALEERGLVAAIKERVQEDEVPILGVCLGMQILSNGSEEGALPGLGLIRGFCRRLSGRPEEGIRVPHMGWKAVHPRRADALLAGLESGARFYFVHSYHLVCEYADEVLATARHGEEFAAMVGRARIYGAQFHPEKSHRYGMRLLRNFAGL